jgi:hypothetical protein
MFSHRRRAQLGLAGGLVVLLVTLTILYQGSRDGLANWRPADAAAAARPATTSASASALAPDATSSARVVNIASLIK